MHLKQSKPCQDFYFNRDEKFKSTKIVGNRRVNDSNYVNIGFEQIESAIRRRIGLFTMIERLSLSREKEENKIKKRIKMMIR